MLGIDPHRKIKLINFCTKLITKLHLNLALKRIWSPKILQLPTWSLSNGGGGGGVGDKAPYSPLTCPLTFSVLS